MKMIKVATVFSGIGAIEQALYKRNISHEIVFACDNGERYIEIDEEEIKIKLSEAENLLEEIQIVDQLYLRTGKINYVQKSYLENYKIKDNLFFQDARFLNGYNFQNKIDLFVGGSPCQSFSISGNHKGLEDTRGTLFYDYARLVKEISPKVFIYENVPGILSNDNGETWKIITEVFEKLGYHWHMEILNSKDFGIPQNRKRVFVVGFRKDLQISYFSFPKGFELTTKTKDYLQKKVPTKYYHKEKGFKWVTNPKNLAKRVSINSDIIRTQAANQQYNWCGDMRFENLKEIDFDPDKTDVYISKFKSEKGVCRKLTPRECLRLMGFSDAFKIVVPDQKMYRQAGNSIVVNVLENILDNIISTGVFGEKND